MPTTRALRLWGSREGELTDRTTSLIRMMGVLRAEPDGRIQRLYNSSRNWEQEWISTPARCFLQSETRGATTPPHTDETLMSNSTPNKSNNPEETSNCRNEGQMGDLELTGDVGGDAGAGTSASSSSSSSHSSSLRGVMLFPSHTE